jgi:hypothetical protein
VSLMAVTACSARWVSRSNAMLAYSFWCASGVGVDGDILCSLVEGHDDDDEGHKEGFLVEEPLSVPSHSSYFSLDPLFLLRI